MQMIQHRNDILLQATQMHLNDNFPKDAWKSFFCMLQIDAKNWMIVKDISNRADFI